MLKAKNRTGYVYGKIEFQIDVLEMLYSEMYLAMTFFCHMAKYISE